MRADYKSARAGVMINLSEKDSLRSNLLSGKTTISGIIRRLPILKK